MSNVNVGESSNSLEYNLQVVGLRESKLKLVL